ncbi:hypothetical protein [Oryzomicrobium sp.]|uniref:hypothetical protein n=1 Tax=Oryzomicrobium sp. TaxID=1911578 RepID=UPI0025EF133A|nr:hypothetical protein [Oryzomicrobium sp.]
MSFQLPSLKIRGKSLLPIVQGGMGVGVSAHRLAGAVARENAVGTIASVDLRRHHPDLMEETGRCRDKARIDAANLVALDREIQATKAMARGLGLVAVNVMRAGPNTPPASASPANPAPRPSSWGLACPWNCPN